jgi:hypothetical protein
MGREGFEGLSRGGIGDVLTCRGHPIHTNTYSCILTNNAQELTPYRYEFKCDKNRLRKYFLSVSGFEPRSLG